MELSEINDGIFVSGQIDADDIKHLKALGVCTLICNRPDNEEPGQISFSEIRILAEKAGMHCHYIPVTMGSVSVDDVVAMKNAIQSAERPLLAYCRSGRRSAYLYEMSQA